MKKQTKLKALKLLAELFTLPTEEEASEAFDMMHEIMRDSRMQPVKEMVKQMAVGQQIVDAVSNIGAVDVEAILAERLTTILLETWAKVHSETVIGPMNIREALKPFTEARMKKEKA